MEIKTPLNLTPEEVKCFNGIVKPQLEELYSYGYNSFEFEHVSIFISQKEFPGHTKRPDSEEVKNILKNIPPKDLSLVSEVYFVSYHCHDDNHQEFKGRTLPLVYKIIIYPKAFSRLKVILTHEIGHVIFEKRLSAASKKLFALVLLQTFPSVRFGSAEEYTFFIREQFADSYELFLNNQGKLNEFSFIYNFFVEHVR